MTGLCKKMEVAGKEWQPSCVGWYPVDENLGTSVRYGLMNVEALSFGR
jgi:hypothetical protein